LISKFLQVLCTGIGQQYDLIFISKFNIHVSI